MKTLSATTLSALLRSSIKTADGEVDVEATLELVRNSLVMGARSKPQTEDFDAVLGAVELAFDELIPGTPIQRKTLLAAAELVCPEHAEKVLKDVLANGDYKGVQKVGFKRLCDVKVAPAPVEAATVEQPTDAESTEA